MSKNIYPETVAEVLDDQMKFKAAALNALAEFSEAKPWSGERRSKFKILHRQLCEAYDLNPAPRLIIGVDRRISISRSCFIPLLNVIVLRGRLSVVTYLHEFAHARGMGERSACRWSINLFRRVFPEQYARCRHDGHMLVAETRQAPGADPTR